MECRVVLPYSRDNRPCFRPVLFGLLDLIHKQESDNQSLQPEPVRVPVRLGRFHRRATRRMGNLRGQTAAGRR